MNRTSGCASSFLVINCYKRHVGIFKTYFVDRMTPIYNSFPRTPCRDNSLVMAIIPISSGSKSWSKRFILFFIEFNIRNTDAVPVCHIQIVSNTKGTSPVCNVPGLINIFRSKVHLGLMPTALSGLHLAVDIKSGMILYITWSCYSFRAQRNNNNNKKIGGLKICQEGGKGITHQILVGSTGVKRNHTMAPL